MKRKGAKQVHRAMGRANEAERHGEKGKEDNCFLERKHGSELRRPSFYFWREKNTPSFPISKQNKHHNIPSGHILVENHMGLQATVPWGQKLGLQSAKGVSGCLPKLSPSSCASWKSEMWWLLSFLSCLQQCKAPPSGIQEDEANASVSAARTLTLWSPPSLSHQDDSSCCYCFLFWTPYIWTVIEIRSAGSTTKNRGIIIMLQILHVT